MFDPASLIAPFLGTFHLRPLVNFFFIRDPAQFITQDLITLPILDETHES